MCMNQTHRIYLVALTCHIRGGKRKALMGMSTCAMNAHEHEWRVPQVAGEALLALSVAGVMVSTNQGSMTTCTRHQ